MPFDTLLYEYDDDGIALVTVNRPDKLNILNKKTLDELAAVTSMIRDDAAVKAVLITGAGDKAFVAGADINELSDYTVQDGKDLSLVGQNVFQQVEQLAKPVIAAINGYALGGGCELAMACHIRVASENARLGLPEVRLGIMPGYAGTQRMSRLIGKGKAMELALTGEPISASEAERIGLVNRVVPEGQAVSASREIAQTILKNGPLAVRAVIESINRGMETPLAEGAYIEATLFALLCATDDMREGTRAFLEKRPPEFKGR